MPISDFTSNFKPVCGNPSVLDISGCMSQEGCTTGPDDTMHVQIGHVLVNILKIYHKPNFGLALWPGFLPTIFFSCKVVF